MTTVSSATATPTNIKALNAPGNVTRTSAMGSLDQGDFLKLLITQLQQQDPTDPVDNKDMLAQMAQFSALAGSTEANATLDEISGKLDALISAQKAAIPVAPAAVSTPTSTPTA